jgi:A/G-specific adenine glycosylase
LDDFSRRILAFYRLHGRSLPWRRTRDPYAIWICEVMAQQTRLETMTAYWRRWMARFPTVRALAAAPLDDVLAAWAGLGYYSRARNLHAAARLIVAEHGGRFPTSFDALVALPGVGRYTAGAIASIAFGLKVPVVDGNVSRVLSRVHGVAGEDARELWRLAGEAVPDDGPGDYNQGLMDLGATVCTPRNPTCLVCPLADLCVARREGRTAELPGRPARAEPPTLLVELAWITRGGRWLLARRAPRGLYGGLWELPEAAALGLEPGGEPLLEHTQKLTHRTLIYRVRAARLPRLPEVAPPYDRLGFHPPQALAELAVSSATAALARKLEKGPSPTWPTPNAPASSSPKVSAASSPASASSATTSTTRTSARPRRARRTASPR